jgi:radical SAM superfamily enzyme YgiQ (UPF0313 family)
MNSPREPRFKHALALNPYFGSSTAAVGVFPPTGLEYIAASMRDHVGKVTLLDLRYEKPFQDAEALSAFIREEIDLLCISVQWDGEYDAVCDFIAKLPAEVTTIVGGHKATLEVEDLFERCPNIDMIGRAEGEDIIRQVADGVAPGEILGLSYRDNGTVVHNANHVLPDLDRIAFPDRSLRRHDYFYTQYGMRLSHRTFDTVLTTRGCPFKCKFCTFSRNALGQKREYTERPLESVIEELKTVTADIVLFADDNMFTNVKRAEKLCDLIIANNLQKIYVVQARIDVAKHRRLLEKAEQAGFKVFLLGVESPHDYILKNLSKGITQKQIRESLAILTQYDFYLHGYFIYGNIGETEEEMLYIPKFAKEIGLDSISFQKLRVEKFSPLEDIVDATPGYYYERVGGPVFSQRYGRKELKQIRNKIRSAFYDGPQFVRIAKKAMRIKLTDGRDGLTILLRIPQFIYKTSRRKAKKRKQKRLAARNGQIAAPEAKVTHELDVKRGLIASEPETVVECRVLAGHNGDAAGVSSSTDAGGQCCRTEARSADSD